MEAKISPTIYAKHFFDSNLNYVLYIENLKLSYGDLFDEYSADLAYNVLNEFWLNYCVGKGVLYSRIN